MRPALPVVAAEDRPAGSPGAERPDQARSSERAAARTSVWMVVGAGAVGLATGYALAQRGLSVVVLEQAERCQRCCVAVVVPIRPAQ